jgi:hypothetical protein
MLGQNNRKTKVVRALPARKAISIEKFEMAEAAAEAKTATETA